MNGYIIALIVILVWFALVFVAHRSKWLERHGMSLYGPFIMWKTRRGKELIDRVAQRRRFWSFYGTASLWICAGAMITIMLLLLWEATIVSQVENPPSPELILGIPGLNPVIPVGYGILGLAVAIVVHEFAHGILTRVGGMKIRSLGLLFLVFPMGAFVEPDEAQLQLASRSKRSRVFATGPATNILVSLVMLGLFSGAMMSSVTPVHDGALAVGVVEGSPANIAGIEPSSVIISVGGDDMTSGSELENRVTSAPGSMVSVTYYLGGELMVADSVTDGLVVAYAAAGYAAYEYGLRPGMVLVAINGTTIGGLSDLSAAMNLTTAGQDVSVTVMSYDSASESFVVDPEVTHIVLSNKHDYYEQYYPQDNKAEYDGRGYLGAGFYYLGINADDVDYYSEVLANPFSGDDSVDEFSRSWLRLIALPFLDLAPLRSPVTDLYEPSGSLAWMPDEVFWILTNSLYWIFWLNLMVGLTNVLPAVPLDGGYLFRDALDYLVGKVRSEYTREQREKVVGDITIALALFVLSLIVWQLVGPAL